MDSKQFNIGDIVALGTHPYFNAGTDVIVSGDHMMLSPLMVVSEVHKSTYTFAGKKQHTFRYQCMWFSTRMNKFINKDIEEIDLKLVSKCESSINKNFLKRGEKIAFKTTSIELGKKKSSLSHDDTSLSAGTGSSVITSLLSFLPPVLQVLDYEPHVTKHKLTEKSGTEIRKVSSIDVKLNYFDPSNDKLQEVTLPLELLELVVEIDERMLRLINLAIKTSRHLHIRAAGNNTIMKPRNLAYRCGNYFLRGYDLLSNKIEEVSLLKVSSITATKKAIISAAPKFDIASDPAAAMPKNIANEIVIAINSAKAVNSFIRIKYKNRNEKITHRTIKDYELIDVKEGALDVNYLVGYCLLRHDKRSFRIDRVQNFEQLDLSF